MPSQDASPIVGYMTVHQTEKLGTAGGLLLLNPHGRPLAFHCTVPLRTNRAQEIMYGASLQRHLFGECIGRALVEKAVSESAEPTTTMLFTNVREMLECRAFGPVPIVHVAGGDGESTSETADSAVQACTSAAGNARPQEFGQYDLRGATGFPQDVARASDFWTQYAPTIDLLEPFTRVLEALAEMTLGAVDGGGATAA